MHSYHDIFDLVSLNNISNTPKSGFFIMLVLNMILELFLSEPHPKSGPKTMHALQNHIDFIIKIMKNRDFGVLEILFSGTRSNIS